jgi:hypothetical protein
MLARRIGRLCLATAVAVTGLGLATATPALADYVYCPPYGGDCVVVVGNPGGPGSPGGPGGPGGGGGGGGVWCPNPYVQRGYGCYSDFWGWYNPQDGCGYRLDDPQPPAGDPVFAGYPPGSKVYTKVCPGGPGGPFTVGTAVLTGAPPGFGGGPSPAQLAAVAINRLGLKGPTIGLSVNLTPNGEGAVGLPVWMWTVVTPTTWGPNSATAAVPGLSVTATAKAEKIDWDMGDGHTVTCTNPGTPYTPSYGNTPSPTCGYRYTQPSTTRAGGRYTVTATTTWQVTWAGGGQNGALVVTRQSQATTEIGEVQVLIQ